MPDSDDNPQREKIRDEVVNLAGLGDYLRVFRMLPKPIRIVGYIGLIAALPIYLGLSPKLAQDLFNGPLEDMEIRLGWRDPHPWNGRYSSGAVKEFVLSRWDGSSKESLSSENSMMINPGQPIFYQLRSDVFSLYDFYVKFDVEIQEGQNHLNWLVRSSTARDSSYKFELQWSDESEYWRFDGFSMIGDQEEEDPLFVNEHLFEVTPLKPGDRLSVVMYAKGCIFDYRFMVDRAEIDFENFENSGEGAVLSATAFAERPCHTYGDFGLIAADTSSTSKLQSIEICAQESEEAMVQYCGDFKGYFMPEPPPGESQ